MVIISLNSNYCNNLNLWLLPYPKDPAHQLSWLVNQLYSAEQSNKKVYIISHIPPGTKSCVAAWSKQYSRIVLRFSSIILGQFYGHTHYDEFSIVYSNKSEPIGVGYIAPSLTPHDGMNPGYRIYLTDGHSPDATHLILDHQTYYFDLHQANTNNKSIDYKLEYTAKDSLNMTDMSPHSWSQYVSRLLTDEAEWSNFYYRLTRSGPMSQECDRKCKHMLLCRLVTFDSADTSHCDALEQFLPQDNIIQEDDDDWWDEE